MKTFKDSTLSYIISGIYLTLLNIFKSIKFSFIIGSKYAFFGLSQALAPMSGFYASTSLNSILYIFRALLTYILTGLSFYGAFIYHIPTLFGTLHISSSLSNKKSKLFNITIPILAIILFLLHPVGNASYYYSIYWLIPIILSCINHKSIFLTSLSSTFITHAVGSIIWLYTKPVDTNLYQTLFSIVWAERLLFALTLTSAYYIISYSYTAYMYLTKSNILQSKFNIFSKRNI